PQNEDDEKRKKDQAGYKRRDNNYLMDGAEFGRAAGAKAPMTSADSMAVGGMSNRVETLRISERQIKSLELLKPGVMGEPPPPPGQEPAVQVRSDFRSTIIWQPDILTDADGNATVKVKYPDSLTTWAVTARVASSGNQFGIGNTSTRTKQPLIVRLQAPRFFVVGDQVTVSAVINNNTDQAMHVASSLAADGLTISGLVIDGKAVKGEQLPVDVKAN